MYLKYHSLNKAFVNLEINVVGQIDLAQALNQSTRRP